MFGLIRKSIEQGKSSEQILFNTATATRQSLYHEIMGVREFMMIFLLRGIWCALFTVQENLDDWPWQELDNSCETRTLCMPPIPYDPADD